jgi:hypothetical protein
MAGRRAWRRISTEVSAGDGAGVGADQDGFFAGGSGVGRALGASGECEQAGQHAGCHAEANQFCNKIFSRMLMLCVHDCFKIVNCATRVNDSKRRATPGAVQCKSKKRVVLWQTGGLSDFEWRRANVGKAGQADYLIHNTLDFNSLYSQKKGASFEAPSKTGEI